MGRNDWKYITISKEMAAALDDIIKRHGRRYGIFDKQQFIRQMCGEFITKYDQDNNMANAKRILNEYDIVEGEQGEES